MVLKLTGVSQYFRDQTSVGNGRRIYTLPWIGAQTNLVTINTYNRNRHTFILCVWYMVGTTLKVPHYLFSQYVANYLYYVTVIQPYFVVHEMIMSPDVIVLIESNKSAHATVKLSTYTQLHPHHSIVEKQVFKYKCLSKRV